MSACPWTPQHRGNVRSLSCLNAGERSNGSDCVATDCGSLGKWVKSIGTHRREYLTPFVRCSGLECERLWREDLSREVLPLGFQGAVQPTAYDSSGFFLSCGFFHCSGNEDYLLLSRAQFVFNDYLILKEVLLAPNNSIIYS